MSTKKYLTIILVLFGLIGLARAQHPDTAWVRIYNGPLGTGWDRAWAVAIDNANNVYVTGYSANAGVSYDATTIKYNANGDTVWVRRYDGPNHTTDWFHQVVVDDSGYVYVAGYSTGVGTGTDYTVIKYTSIGDTVWVRRHTGLGANGGDAVRAMTVDAHYNVYVTGASKGAGSDRNDYMTIKYDKDGVEQWMRRYSYTTSDDNACAIAVDGSGNVYVTGYSNGIGTGADWATIKYTSTGDTAEAAGGWIRRYNGPASSGDGAYSVAVDGSGNVYVAGYGYGGATPSPGNDFTTIKYTSTGDTAWVRLFNGSGNGDDQANSIKVDGSGNVYVGGYTTSAGVSSDFLTIKYNATGDTQWVRTYNGRGNDADVVSRNCLRLDGSNNVYVAGTSVGGPLPSPGVDYLTVKYSTDGIEKWTARHNGPANGEDMINDYCIAVNSAGIVAVTGQTAPTSSYDFMTIKYDTTLHWVVNATAGAHGSIDPSGDVFVYDGDDATFTITPDLGYHTVDVLVDNTSLGVLPSYTFDDVTADHTISAYFLINSYTITAAAIDGGTITPSGAVTITYGSDTTFSITPDLGHHLDSLIVDGVNHGADSTSFTFEFVDTNHDITAYFDINTYTITATAIDGGTITPSGAVIVTYGSDTTFVITPDIGHHLDSLIVDGVNHGADSTSYAFEAVDNDHTIDAYFSINIYTITATATTGGAITPSGAVIISYGSDTTFVITPDLGHHLDSLIVDGINHGADSTSYAFEAVDNDHTIDAYFSINIYTIMATATTGGAITPSGDIIIEYGVDTTFTITPDLGYQIAKVLVDNVSVGAVTEYTFEDVSANHTIHAVFATPGWAQIESIVPADGKFIKDGGALVGVPGTGKDPSKLYAFLGTKTNRFRKYTVGSGWTDAETLLFGHKYKYGIGMDTVKFNKKFPGKGAALCYDGTSTIYATKGNGTHEFYAYDILTGIWTPKAFVPTPKPLKGGTSIRYFDGKVYLLAGGQKKDPLVDNFWMYDPLGDTTNGTPWTALGKLPLGPNTKVWKDGASIVEVGGTFYAVKSADKANFFYAYDWGTSTWLERESMPIDDSSYHRYKKKLIVKDGAATATDSDVIYATKGGGTEPFWKYTPGTPGVWERLDRLPIEKIDKKHAPKTGAAMAFVDGKVWLLVGNKQVDFWWYVPTTEKSKVKGQNSKLVGQGFSPASGEANLKVCPTLSINPNPFSKLTTIRYNVPTSGKVSLKLYNTTGKLISTLLDDYKTTGSYSLEIRNSTSGISSGVYFIRYESGTHKSETKLIVQ